MQQNGFIEIVLDKGEHEIELAFNYEVIRIYQDFEKDNVGKVTIQYGPLVYCAESIDNFDFDNPNAITINKNGNFKIIEDGKTFIRTLDYGKDINIRTNLLKVNGYINGEKVELILIFLS